MKTLRKLKSAEILLLVISFLCTGALIWSIRKPKFAADMKSPEVSYKTLVRAMQISDESSIRRLTTPKGFSQLKSYAESRRFGSWQTLGNGLAAQANQSVHFPWDDEVQEDFGREFSHWGLKFARRPQRAWSLYFHRRDEGWKIDEFSLALEKDLHSPVPRSRS